MKYFNLKFLTFFLTALLAFGVGWAGTETVTFSEQYSAQTDMTISGYTGTTFTLSFSNGTNSAKPTYYTNGSAVRMYKSNTMTVSSSKTITKIELTFGSSDGTNEITTNVGTYSSGTWTGSVSSVVFTVGGTTGNRRLSAVTVTTSDGPSLTPVTLSFPESNYTAFLGQSFTAPDLTINPSAAASEVTYSSSDESVATVDASGNVTPVALGTTTITASISNSETYNNSTAFYTLTVKPNPDELAILDFTSPNYWTPALPEGSDNKFVEETEFSDGTYTVKVAGSTGEGCYWLNSGDALLIGKLGAYLQLPAFDKPVERIVIDGHSSASGKVTQNIFVGDDAVSTETTSAKVTQTYEIAPAYQAAGKVYTLRVTNANNTQIQKIYVYFKEQSSDPELSVTPPSITINDEGGSFSVFGQNLGGDNVGVTRTNGEFKPVLSATTGSVTNHDEGYENKWWYFTPASDNGGSVNGKINVTYEGYGFSGEDSFSVGNGATGSKLVNVTYKPDIYIVGDYGINEGWNFTDGTNKMSEAGGVYSIELNVENTNTYVAFARKVGAGVGFNTRYVFTPVSDNNWEMDADSKEGTINVYGAKPIHFQYAGLYVIEINTNNSPATFTITRTLPQAAKPKITPNGGNFPASQTVALSCETEGADIYYTTDNTEPSAENGTLYEGEIALTSTTTLKAIAVKEGMRPSEVATANFTKTGKDYLSEVNALGNGKNFTFVGNVVVTFKGTYDNHTLVGLRDVSQNNANGHGGGVFHNTATDLAVGQVLLPGWTGKTNVYAGLTQIENADGIELAAEPAEVLPFERSGFEFTADNLSEHISEYLILRNITISDDEDKDNPAYKLATWTNGTKTVVYTLFNRFNIDCEDGNYKSLTGVLNVYNGTIQVYPLELVPVDKVATPTFDPAAGTYTTIQNVTISSETADATISYKIGENGEWKTYTEPIEVAESCTITAKATKTGMLESDEASATYTINLPTLEAPTFEPEAGTYDVAQNVAISAAEGATISYKIGDAEAWTTYSKPITVNESCIITAKATKKGFIDSPEASAEYKFRQKATLSFGETTAFTVYPNDTKFTAPTLTTNPEGLTPIKYTSSDEDVAAFVEGELIIGSKLATTTITAAFEGNDDYKPASATYTITVEPRPCLVADETVDMGTEKTKEFDVVGENLKGVVTLTCNNENFVVTPTEITPTEGAVEQTVTVTYNGSSYTDETATITVASQDAESVIVTVKAHIAKPALIAVEDELEFEALVGKTDSKTFIVTGENLKGDVTLTLNDENNVYSIEPTTITKADAEADGGKKVTVTYTPMTENIDDATITVASTDADPVTVTLTGMATLPNPVIAVDDEPINMGTNPTGTFDLTAENLRGNITLTSDNPNFTVEPATITPEEAEDIVTVTVTYNGNDANGENATITITTEGLAEPITITVTAQAETKPIAAPTFAPAAGTYTEAKEVAIACATPGVTITYAIDGVDKGEYNGPFTISDGEHTVTATAKMGTRTVYTPATSSATYKINVLPAAQIDNKYYYLVNNALPEMYANVAGRRTLNFVADPADKAGTVFRVMTDPDTIGQVETLRSQGVDMQGYAKRAMNYVTPIVQMVVNKLNDMDGVDNATGTGSILGENGLGKILAEFNKSFDYHLYVEGNAGAYRIYARTPSMQRVVDFYNNPDNKSQIQEKLPMLEDYINQVLAKIRSKVPAGMNANVFEPFSLVKVWEKMGSKLIKPVKGENDDITAIMAFYDQVLSNKEYVWDFAYQTAKIYLDNIKGTQTYADLDPEYKLYIEKMEEIRPETKFFIIQNGNDLDYVREDHTYIQNNNDQTFWTLTERPYFTVNFPEENKYGSKLVTTLYTDFAYDVPEDVTAYKVTDIDANGFATIADLGKNVPAQTPVLLMTDATAKVTTKNVTLNTTDGTRPNGNKLEGPDYLINKYKITSPTVEALFAIAAGIVGGEESDAYQTYVKPYEYLKLRTSGTVNNRYFWGLNSDDLKKCSEKNSEDKLDCVVRSLGVNDEGKDIGFYRNREALLANQAFIPNIEFNPILLEVVATPTFDPEAGTYNEAQTVTIACETEGATIYYKMGDEENWTKYDPEQPINVAQTTTIQAYAVKDGLGDSEIAEATYTIELPAEAPTFNPVPGSYEEAQDVTIIAPEGATVSYRIDGGKWQTYTEGEKIHVDATQTIEAKVVMEGMSESAVATGYYVIDIPEALPTNMPVFDGYYSILNSGKYANVQGRKTLTFTTEPDAQAGTVIRLKSDNTGKVEVLRSQAADLQRYAYRALDYVPDIVQIVVDKLGAEGEDHILGQEGLDAIMDKFDKSFKPDLYIEKAGENGYRIYGKTPSMQPVVDFYRENKDKVEAKLPDLVAFINSALAKLRAKAEQAGMNGDNVFVDFDLKTIWERMGGNLTDPEVDEMGFYRDVLNYKDNVWNFAYQTATFYLEKIKNTSTYESLLDELGEYAQYLDKIDQIHPDFKYYIVANEGVTKPDFISEGNTDIANDAARTIWTIEPRENFTVNFPEENKLGDEYVTTLYTDFAYTLPEGVTAWAVESVNEQGIAKLAKVDGTTIAAQTPVLLKSTTAGDVVTFGITTAEGTVPATNELVGPDYLIETYQIKTPEVVKLFEAIKSVLGENIYNDLVEDYGHLQLRNSGTVNNKYFWGLNEEEVKSCAKTNPETGKLVKVVRSLGIKDDILGFNDNEHVYTNKALLVSTEHSAITFTLRGDINRDGQITIADVPALIDILLELPAEPYHEPSELYPNYPKGLDYEAADFNENGDITIHDVSALIDYLLGV